MENGYYWLQLDGEEPEIVKVDDDSMYRCGSDVPCPLEDGKWVEYGDPMDVVSISGPIGPLKLWVVGENSPNPTDWSIWSQYAIVIAESAEQACALVGSCETLATKIPMETAQLLVKMPEPSWRDDL